MDERQEKQVVELIEYAMCNPEDADPIGIAQEIESIFKEDHDIAENMESYWANLNAGSAK